MKISLYILLALFISFHSSAQNLVPNASFEDTISSPCNGYSFPALSNWISPSSVSSPDYYHPCNSPLVWGVPDNQTGFQDARTGIAYAGIVTYWEGLSSRREYIENQLTQQLINGTKYYWSFWISRADYLDYASNNIGICLAPNPVTSATNEFIPLAPIGNLYSVVLDSANWTQVCGEYIANGGEEYLVIGNFFDNSQTNIIQVQQGTSETIGAYYYIDDVYLSIDPIVCNGNVGIEEPSMPIRQLMKVVDILGRETEDKPNSFLIYIYSDGTTEKVYRFD